MSAVKSAPYMIVKKRTPRPDRAPRQRRSQSSLYSVRRMCPLCKQPAIVPLTAAMMREQVDGTTHVCHPDFGGCGHGAKLKPEGV